MLDHLRQKAMRTLGSTEQVLLASFGPADIQTGSVACQAQELTLYVFIPLNSEHLLNLEHRTGVAVDAGAWSLKGHAYLLPDHDVPPGVRGALETAAGVPGRFAAIHPTRLTLHAASGEGNTETIDF